MLQVIGEIYPEAVAIAFNPVAIIIVILLLMSQRGKPKAAAYAVGWMIGLTAIGIIMHGLMEANRSNGSPVSNRLPVLKLLLGLLFLSMAVYELRLVPKRSQNDLTKHKWFGKLDSFTALQVLVMGAAMAGLNLKNVGLVVSASSVLMGFGLYGLPAWIIFGLFVLLGSIPIITPVVYDYLRSPKSETRLKAWRDWLLANNALVLFPVINPRRGGNVKNIPCFLFTGAFFFRQPLPASMKPTGFGVHSASLVGWVLDK